jgi:2-oxoisovalerate dehydrogenase E1 component alpha subunit
VLLWRGFGLPNFANQCFSNAGDAGKGRQMPVHYGSRALNLQTISSPLATQISQASGSAYGLKLEGKGRAAFCYFGEGAASEGDFHAGFNIAATLECPVVFFCRNNGYAISTPSHEQYRGDGIISRAEGYGMHSIRVDGNDLLAVFEATQAARQFAVAHNRPVLVEAMSYRVGHHSTSDDSTRYRTAKEIQTWADAHSPVTRFRLLLESRGLWDADKEVAAREAARKEVLDAFNAAEATRKPPVSELFTDCYDQLPPHLVEQRQQFYEHLSKHADKYGLEEYVSDPMTQAATGKKDL